MNNRIKYVGNLVLVQVHFKREPYTIILETEDYTKVRGVGQIYLQAKGNRVNAYATSVRHGGAVSLSRILYPSKEITRIYFQNHNTLDFRKSNIRLYHKNKTL